MSHNSNPFSPFIRKASCVLRNCKWKWLQSGGLCGGLMDVNSEGRQAQNRPERDRQREEVMMERRVCEGPEEAGQREESRAQLVSSVCQCKSFSGVRRGAMERHTDAPRMMEVTESYQAQSWPWPLFLCSVCQSTIYLFIYLFLLQRMLRVVFQRRLLFFHL